MVGLQKWWPLSADMYPGLSGRAGAGAVFVRAGRAHRAPSAAYFMPQNTTWGRRRREWRSVSGPSQEVYARRAHRPSPAQGSRSARRGGHTSRGARSPSLASSSATSERPPLARLSFCSPETRAACETSSVAQEARRRRRTRTQTRVSRSIGAGAASAAEGFRSLRVRI